MKFSSVAVVLAHRVPELWAQCRPLIQSAIATSPDRGNVDRIYDQLLMGERELLVGLDSLGAVQAVLVLRYQPERDGFIVHIQAAAGRGLLSARDEWAELLRWLCTKKVKRIQLHCQAAQERLWRRMGFETAYRVMWFEMPAQGEK
ncbi:hypothetical protein [Hydrogenophaga crocea]|uniref:N-acetyltransferase domain-containing protein n=1 Tax=Hydrogenophaga crocea TaxID=2716225 RepID=A0A6G8IHJ7_9BURK|nr:hypothetical protein [Hydrogenophaga crocea]QIM52496.1 hypothetical protein G9Q37_10235 [Hydrogenophaga crocea]